MDASESDLRQAGGISLLGLGPALPDLDAPTLQIPLIAGENVPWVEPRRVGADGPVWDATDEIYITYDQEGHRALVTTGRHDIWRSEHSYQRTGSARYEQLRDLAGDAARTVAGVGKRVGDAARRLRPGWTDSQVGEWPPVDVDRTRDDARRGPTGGARSADRGYRVGVAAAPRHARDHGDRLRVPERSGEEQRIRSHRHCPGCSGHGTTQHSGFILVLRAIAAWLFGWGAVYSGELGITFLQYVGLTSFATLVAILLHPVWREFSNAEERHANGGRR